MTHTNHRKRPLSDVGLPRRLGAIFYDWLIIAAILLLWTLAWTMSGIRIGQEYYAYYVAGVYLVIFAYFAWGWCGDGQTIGMAIWKIRLTGERNINWMVAVTRFAAAIISTAFLGLGFLWIIVDDERLAWHDKFSGTYPVRDPG